MSLPMEQKSKIVNKKTSKFALNWLTRKCARAEITTFTVIVSYLICIVYTMTCKEYTVVALWKTVIVQ